MTSAVRSCEATRSPRSVAEDRRLLAQALAGRVEDVLALQHAGGVDKTRPPAEAEIWTNMASVALSSFTHWLATGEIENADGLDAMVRLGGEGALQSASIAVITKAMFRWRDATTCVLEQESDRLGLLDEVRSDAIVAARFSCDAMLVRISKWFDSTHHELQVSLERERSMLLHQASHDALTGLANRSTLFDRLGRSLQATSRDNSRIALLFVDIDGFKEVNDNLGHAVGDRVLVSAATELERSVRPGDLVSRFGGDEFVILCDRIAKLDARAVAVDVTRRVQIAFADARPPGVGTPLTASVGIALQSSSADAPDALVAAADAAMYRAKFAGPGRYEIATALTTPSTCH